MISLTATYILLGIVAFLITTLVMCCIFNAAQKVFGKFGAIVFICVSIYLMINAYATAEEKQGATTKKIRFLKADPQTTYLIDTGSYVKENFVHLQFTTNLLPPDAMLYLDCCPVGEEDNVNAYNTFLRGTVKDFPNPLEFPNPHAMKFTWVFYTDYTPGPTVHTNGVAVAEFIKAVGHENVAVPKRSTIWKDAEMVWPSAERLKLADENTTMIEVTK